MIYLFKVEDARLKSATIGLASELAAGGLVWVDAVAPDETERAWLRDALGIDTEAVEEDEDIEASARIYEEGATLYLRSDFLAGGHLQCEIVPVRMALRHNLLVTLHEEDVPILRLQRLRCRGRPVPDGGALTLLLDLYALDAEYSADVLEAVHGELKEISGRVLAERRGTDEEAAEFITRLARQEDLNGTIRRNLMDSRRVLSYLTREQRMDKASAKLAQQIRLDIDSLDTHTAFIFDKINFLMDAIIGFINVNQNKVVKIFSVAAVAMLPPTLIASIYGMNFEHMPELRWVWGYPMSLAMMLVAVAVPFWFFKRKGWLK